MKKVLTIGLILGLTTNLFAQNTWSKNIAQLVYNNCSSCHNPNGIGPFSLLTYADAESNKSSIKFAVSQKNMPPWIADKSYQQYAHERVLTDAEIDMVVKWVDAGAPEGNSAETPPPPVYSTKGFITKTPDLELKLPHYRSKATASGDDYVCFSVPSGLTSNKKIRAFEVIPGNHAIVHHVLVYIDPTGSYATDTSGGVCTGPTAGLIGGYVPGSPPTVFASNGKDFNLGFEIKSGSNIVLAMHYPEGSYGMLDSTMVRFWFYDDQIDVRQVGTAPLIENWSFALAPNQRTDVEAQYKNSFGDYSILSVFPHMHLLGDKISSYAITPTNDTLKFANIPHWDFEWQEFLFFKHIIKLPKSSVIYGKGTYDNTNKNHHNPNDPPILVRPGLNTSDEMFLIYFHFMQYQSGDENRDIENLSSLRSFDVNHNLKVQVYPNPSSDVVHFNLPITKLSKTSLSIYDVRGLKVSDVITTNGTMNAEGTLVDWKIPEDLKPGIYFYSINIDGNMGNGSFLIQR